jgi:dTDP-L-rhamnose 4-epimerase
VPVHRNDPFARRRDRRVKVLVTGGAGFIGSHVVDLFVDEGWEVVVLDSLLPSVHAAPPDYMNSDADYRVADVTDQEAVADAVSGVDAVSHQAAMVGLETSPKDAVAYVAHNDLGTAVLLRALFESGFRGPVVLAGSMVVYGEGSFECPNHGHVRPGPRSRLRLEEGRFNPECPRCGRDLLPVPVTEEDATDPRNVYAATKLHQEHLCFSFGRETGVPIVSLRYHNVYGSRMPRNTSYAGVAALFRSRLTEGKAPLIYEDGRQMRDFVHVSDIARANALALSGNPPTGVFNIATGEPHSVGEMADALRKAFGPETSEPEVTGRFRLGDVRHVFASPARAAAELGFKAAVSFHEGMTAFAGAPLREALAGTERPSRA